LAEQGAEWKTEHLLCAMGGSAAATEAGLDEPAVRAKTRSRRQGAFPRLLLTSAGLR
jgi:hypothetical protein